MTSAVTKDILPDFKRRIKKLTSREVLVGVPAEDASRDQIEGEEPISNAALMYIHENGSPANNLPARPVIKPAIEKKRKESQKRFIKAADAAISGNDPEMDRQFNAVGQITASQAHNLIRNGLEPPLSPVTVAVRKSRGEAPRQGEKPLYDTGQLLRAISYVVR